METNENKINELLLWQVNQIHNNYSDEAVLANDLAINEKYRLLNEFLIRYFPCECGSPTTITITAVLNNAPLIKTDWCCSKFEKRAKSIL